jgi:predicted CoA-binding protein
VFLTTDAEIAQVLRSVQTIALVGASDRPDRPSHRVLRFLVEHGYRVFPVNPALAGTQIEGMLVYESLAALPGPVDMIDVFRRSEHLPDIVEDCLSAGVPVLWTQLGVVHPAALALTADRGVRVVADRCPAIEWPRLARLGLLG